MSLRAILSGSRVKKRPAPSAAASGSKKRKTTATATTTAARATPWSTDTALRLTKAGTTTDQGKKTGAQNRRKEDDAHDGEDAWLDDDDDRYPLHNTGLATQLADDLSLRDVVQALRYARGDMFDVVPGQKTRLAEQTTTTMTTTTTTTTTTAGPPTGSQNDDNDSGGVSQPFVGNSTRVAELLQMRRRIPPLATTAHVAALLPNATATERETAALVRAGVLRRVVQPQWRRGVGGMGGGGRGGNDGADNDARLRRALALGTESLGEVLIETAALRQLVEDSSGLDDETKKAFLAWLGGGGGGDAAAAAPPTSSTGDLFTINGQPAPQLTGRRPMVDALVRAGFLVGRGSAVGTGAHATRPEDRTSMLSLETVARAASGSYGAVGGVGAVYAAGGGGGGGQVGRRDSAACPEDLLMAIPGHGLFVKLVSGALAHLVGLLAQTPFRETLESSLRERWNAGGGGGGGGESGTRGARPRSRTSHPGWLRRVPASRTRKWKDFYGLRFEWVLAEALGAGLVELFDTGSVGRGVRLLS